MAVIDSKKLLPSGKPGGSIAESQKPFLVPVSNIIYKKDVNISQKLLKPADRETQEPGGSLVVVKKKVLHSSEELMVFLLVFFRVLQVFLVFPVKYLQLALMQQ